MNTVLNIDPVSEKEILAQPMFLGDDLGIQRYDVVKYPVFQELYLKQQEFMWRPTEINLKEDRNCYESLGETERFIFDANLRFQTMGDSMFARSAEEIKRYVSNTELEYAIAVWSFMENVHSESYTHVLKAITKDPQPFFDSILEDGEIVRRAEAMREYFDGLLLSKSNSIKEDLFRSVVSFQVAEGLIFYVSFACSFWFGSGGLMTGNADIIKLIQRDENPVSPDTQVLTTGGWIRIDELKEGQKVAQYNEDGTVSFVVPMKIIEKDFDGNLINYKSKTGHLDMLMTPEHRVIYEHIPTGELREEKSGDFKPNQLKRIPVAGDLFNPAATVEGLGWYERFLIALQADGTLIKDDPNGGKRDGSVSGCIPVSFSLKKKRKILRLERILDHLGFDFSMSDPNPKGLVSFYVKVPINRPRTKNFSDWVHYGDKSARWCDEFIEEILRWDGHVRPDTGSWYYSSVDEKNVEIVQTVACLAGYKTYKYKQEDDRKESYSTVHRLSILPEKYAVDCQTLKNRRREVPYKGKVYCLSVMSGMFLARRNNGIFVTGNCHAAITQNILKLWRSEPSEGFQGVFSDDFIYEAFGRAVENEKRWAEYLFSEGPLVGLSAGVLGAYSEWLANNRLRSLGLNQIFEQPKNPIGGWLNQFSDSSKTQVAPQEREITTYKKSSVRGDVKSDAFAGFEF